MVDWVQFGRYKWSCAVVDLCLQHQCAGDRAKLLKSLNAFYADYRWAA